MNVNNNNSYPQDYKRGAVSDGQVSVSSKRQKSETEFRHFGSEFQRKDPRECFQAICDKSEELGIVMDSSCNLTDLNKKHMLEYDSIRDRYSNLTPLLSGLVSRELNANHISLRGVSTDFTRSIAPKPGTFWPFYNWLLEEGQGKKPYILNLVPLEEQGNQDKFHQYHPLEENGVKNFQMVRKPAIMVTTLSKSEQLSEAITREIEVKNQTQSCKIMVENYLHWKDSNVVDLDKLEKLVNELIEKKNDKGNGPIVVHCSAGMGRTGTVIAAAMVKQIIQGSVKVEGIEVNRENYRQAISEIVLELRLGGGGGVMIQSSGQLGMVFKYAERLLGLNGAV